VKAFGKGAKLFKDFGRIVSAFHLDRLGVLLYLQPRDKNKNRLLKLP